MWEFSQTPMEEGTRRGPVQRRVLELERGPSQGQVQVMPNREMPEPMLLTPPPMRQPERDGGRFRNFIKRYPVQIGVVALAASLTTLLPHTLNDYRGSEPLIDTEYVKLYPLLAPDYLPSFPLLSIDPNGASTESAISGLGQQFEPSPATIAKAIVDAEIADTKEGVFTCGDGSKAGFVTYGKLTKAEMQENLCDDAVDTPQKKRAEDIEKTGKSETTKAGTVSPGCEQYEDGERILCEAQRYKGIYYTWAGGHRGYGAFIKKCSNPQEQRSDNINKPYSSKAAHGGNPSPCGLDCSGLVSVAVNTAFNQKKNWDVAGIKRDKKYWKWIPMRKAQLGDVVTRGANTHVEIVREMKGTVAHTFGAHATGKPIGNSIGKYDAAYTYVGPEA